MKRDQQSVEPASESTGTVDDIVLTRYLECLAGITSNLLSAPDPWGTLPRIIEWLRDTTDADRCRYVECRITPDGEALATRQISATSPAQDIGNRDAEVNDLDLRKAGLTRWLDVLGSGDMIQGATDGLPATEAAYLESDGVEYTLVAPLIADDDLIGFISIDTIDNNRRLGQQETLLLRSAANVISLALKRQSIEHGLRKAHALLASIINSASEFAIIATDLKFRVLHYNPAAFELFGYSVDEVTGRTLAELEILDSASEDITSEFIAALLESKKYHAEFDVRAPDGEYRTLKLVASGMESANGSPIGYIIFARDITDELKAQRRSMQSERMESIGLLAGGIAHDFNNILMGILGYVGLAKDKLDAEDPVQRMLSIIEESGDRAAGLTGELLAYARGGKFQSVGIRLDEQVNSLLKLLGTSLPGGVEIVRDFASDLPYIIADPVQIQQVVMNICLNAGDAIREQQQANPTGYVGEISITTGVIKLDWLELDKLDELGDAKPGRYVFLTITDNGCGMDAKTLTRIFEPFFTTKFTGRGLGLAAVEGIIRNHGGFLTVESTPGQGSRFAIHLPESSLLVEEHTGEITHILTGAETVLFVDDEEIVRQLALLTLTNLGYNVLLANDGSGAFDVLAEHSGEIDLAILDLSMPGMSGESILAEMQRNHPTISTLATSGYDETSAREQSGDIPMTAFLQKPYTPEVLSRAVRHVLDEHGAGK